VHRRRQRGALRGEQALRRIEAGAASRLPSPAIAAFKAGAVVAADTAPSPRVSTVWSCCMEVSRPCCTAGPLPTRGGPSTLIICWAPSTSAASVVYKSMILVRASATVLAGAVVEAAA